MCRAPSKGETAWDNIKENASKAFQNDSAESAREESSSTRKRLLRKGNLAHWRRNFREYRGESISCLFGQTTPLLGKEVLAVDTIYTIYHLSSWLTSPGLHSKGVQQACEWVF